MEDGRGAEDPLEVARGAAKESVLGLLRESGPASARKVLVAEETLARPLSLIVQGEDLMQHFTDPYIHPLGRDSRVDRSVEVVVFLVRSVHPEMLREVEKWMHDDLGDPAREDERSFVVAFVPGRTAQCMERLGGASVTVLDCGLHFFPVGDVLSMELPGVFRDYHVRGDPSSLYVATAALEHLESLLGTLPVVHALGAAAKAAADIRDWPEHGDGGSGKMSSVEPTLDEAIVLDRRADLLSIVCSTFTYEALVDDILGIEDEFVDLSNVEGVRSDGDLAHPDWKPHCPKCAQSMERSDERGASVPEYVAGWRCENVHFCGRTGSKEQEEGRAIRWKCGKASCKTDFCRRCGKRVRFSSDDPLYAELRDVHIDELQSFMNTWVDKVQTLAAECKQAQDAREKASLMNQSFRYNAAASTHMIIAKCITSAKKTEESAAAWKAESFILEGFRDQLFVIEDLIYDECSLHEVFRLLCLHSLVNGGIEKHQLEVLQRAVLHTYGHRQALTFAALERCGLLRVHDGIWPQAGAWKRLSHDFRVNAADAHGRVPLSVRIVENAVESVVPQDGQGVGTAERRLAAAAHAAGPFGWRARQEAVDLVGPASSVRRHAGRPGAAGGPRKVLVVFLGGVTYGELAALRRLEVTEGGRRKFLVATTELLASRRLLSSMGCEDPAVFDNGASEAAATPTGLDASIRSRVSTIDSFVAESGAPDAEAPEAAGAEPHRGSGTALLGLEASGLFSRFGIR